MNREKNEEAEVIHREVIRREATRGVDHIRVGPEADRPGHDRGPDHRHLHDGVGDGATADPEIVEIIDEEEGDEQDLIQDLDRRAIRDTTPDPVLARANEEIVFGEERCRQRHSESGNRRTALSEENCTLLIYPSIWTKFKCEIFFRRTVKWRTCSYPKIDTTALAVSAS